MDSPTYKDSVWFKIMQYGLEFIGLHYGTYRAFVVDNNDPENLGRLKLRIPHINPRIDIDIWAFPMGIWGGKDYGINLIPLQGDMVFVEFTNGNPEYPLWKHAGYARGEKPEEFNNSNYGFKTPRGTLILINDKKDSEEILIRHKNKLEWLKIIKEEYEMEAKLIKLGKNGEQPGVLGDTLKEKMNSIDAKLDELMQELITHIHPTNVGPSGPPVNANKIQTIKEAIAEIDGTLDEYLSEKVKIDK